MSLQRAIASSSPPIIASKEHPATLLVTCDMQHASAVPASAFNFSCQHACQQHATAADAEAEATPPLPSQGILKNKLYPINLTANEVKNVHPKNRGVTKKI